MTFYTKCPICGLINNTYAGVVPIKIDGAKRFMCVAHKAPPPPPVKEAAE
jgi:hypothetical protein